MTDIDLTDYTGALGSKSLRRNIASLAFSLGLYNRLRPHDEFEKHARDLREARQDWSTKPVVVFISALIGKHRAKDWDQVTGFLGQTAQSVMAQTDQNWLWYIIGDDRPDTLPDDPRIRFVTFSKVAPGNDQAPKLAELAGQLDALNVPESFVVLLDADDLVSSQLVASVRADACRDGYIFSKGYIYDHATQTLTQTDTPTLKQPCQRPLWKDCGTCAALPFIPGTNDQAFLQMLFLQSHNNIQHYCRFYDLNLQQAKKPFSIYRFNTGQNTLQRLGRGNSKLKRVHKNPITDPKVIADIQAEFSLKTP